MSSRQRFKVAQHPPASSLLPSPAAIMTRHIFDLLSLRRVPAEGGDAGVSTFESVTNPEAIGRDEKGVAFGGCVLALALHAALQTLPPAQMSTAAPQSIMGNFLAAVTPQQPLKLSVTSIRDTRSFATRLVTATQLNKRGQPTVCFLASVDMVVPPRTAVLIDYSQPMNDVYSHHSALPEYKDVLTDMIKEGKIPEATREDYLRRQDGFLSLFQSKISYPGVQYDTAGALAVKKLGPSGSEAAKPAWKRVSTEWFKLNTPPERSTTQEDSDILTLSSRRLASACSLAFVLDMLVFFSIWHSYHDFEDVSASLSLDFALRFHCDDLDATRWHFRESNVPVAADERSYNEAKCWQEKEDGTTQLVATMNQAGICRKRKSAL